MAVDKNGFISQPNFNGFQPAFSQLITDTVQQLDAAVPDLIHSIYVYGSVAGGCAVERQSDLDMTVIFKRDPDAGACEKMAAVMSAIEQDYPVITKIDIDPGILDVVMLPESTDRCGYWLKHHCVCVYGEDQRERFKPVIPSRSIAVAVNGDFLSVLNGYVAEMKPSLDSQQRHVLQRAAARKAIRSTNILREESDRDWPMSLEEHCSKFNERYPALVEEMDYFLNMSFRPRGDIMAFAGRITTFTYWLNAEFYSRQR